MNDVADPIYIDGADEVNSKLELIKGGGGLTREKIIASASKLSCIIDKSKIVDRFGKFPVAIEVIPMARVLFQGRSWLWEEGQLVGFITDNGNQITMLVI